MARQRKHFWALNFNFFGFLNLLVLRLLRDVIFGDVFVYHVGVLRLFDQFNDKFEKKIEKILKAIDVKLKERSKDVR